MFFSPLICSNGGILVKRGEICKMPLKINIYFFYKIIKLQINILYTRQYIEKLENKDSILLKLSKRRGKTKRNQSLATDGLHKAKNTI